MTILDPRYSTFIAITDQDITRLTAQLALRPDAVVVKTHIGGAVWLDPAYTQVISDYRTGTKKGDESPVDGVLHVEYPATPSIRVGTVTPIVTVEQIIKNSTLPLNIQITVSPVTVVPGTLPLNIIVDVQPDTVTYIPHVITSTWNIQINKIPVPLESAIRDSMFELLQNKIQTFYDSDRTGKILLNIQNNIQIPIINAKSGYGNSKFYIKLDRPLQFAGLYSPVTIVRELSPSYFDKVSLFYSDVDAARLYLRPLNKNIASTATSPKSIRDATLTSLYTTGAVDRVGYSDPILENWYTSPTHDVPLNVDYSDFSNFVFYSSAKQRLIAFKNKLSRYQQINSILTEQSASISAITSGSIIQFTGSAVYPMYDALLQERMALLQSLDGYERFLFYSTGIPYSSSFTDNLDDGLYYLVDATWPKISGSLITTSAVTGTSVYSVVPDTTFYPAGDYVGNTSWWDAMTFIAEAYDSQNKNKLSNNLPAYLIEDLNSSDFLTFVDMIGHQFDIIKLYADHMTYIYDRGNDPSKFLAKNLVWKIAESVGIKLPSQYAIEDLLSYTVGPSSSHDFSIETWKRFLHNQMWLLKSKGTAASLRGLLTTYGVSPDTIQIKESVTPSEIVTQSFEQITEYTNTIKYSGSSYIEIPFSSSDFTTPSTVQVRWATSTATQQMLFTVGSSWGVRLTPTTQSYGVVQLLQNTTVVGTSDEFDLFNGSYYSVAIKRHGSGPSTTLHVYESDAGELISTSITSASLSTWSSSPILYLGSSGSTNAPPFNGTIDELRIWSEHLYDTVLSIHAQYPGLYNGNTQTSAKNSLLTRLSFTTPLNLGTGSVSQRFIYNESPYIRTYTGATVLSKFSASGFADESTHPFNMAISQRTNVRYTPNVGATQYTSDQTSVIDTSAVRYLSDISGSSIPVLSPNKSIRTLRDKYDDTQQTNVIGFYVSPMSTINDSIVRSIGNINYQDFIGDPSHLELSTYPDLIALWDIYKNDYSYRYNINQYITIVEKLFASIFEQAHDLIPIRAKLLTGVVLESPFLSRNKTALPPVQTAGLGTRDEQSTVVLYPDALTYAPNTIDATFPTFHAQLSGSTSDVISATVDTLTVPIDTTEIILPSALQEYYETHISTTDTTILTTEYPSYATSLVLSDELQVDSGYHTIDDKASAQSLLNSILTRFNIQSILHVPSTHRQYVSYLLSSHRPSSNIKIISGINDYLDNNLFVPTIEPYCDIYNIGTKDYFMSIVGAAGVVEYRYVLRDLPILRNRGTWTANTVYQKNDIVTQIDASGSAIPGNTREFVCITELSTLPFRSTIPPYSDTEHWRPAKYVSEPYIDHRVVSNINNTIELIVSKSGVTPFSGYHPSHYRFYRDTTTAKKRRTWDGCKQTDDTTIDGDPAIQITLSAEDTLVVVNGATPIQKQSGISGPILDVK